MPIIDLAHSIQGTDTIPVDHGYYLFSSIVHHIPELHGNKKVGIHPIYGSSMGNGNLIITSKSKLSIRSDTYCIPVLLPLAGKTLDLNGKKLIVGVPRLFRLSPSPTLHARIVTIKGFMDRDVFGEALQRQLNEMNVSAQFEIGKCRTVKIQDKKVVGYYVRLMGLSPEESIRVQEQGLGGRRRFGCGVFVRMREEKS